MWAAEGEDNQIRIERSADAALRLSYKVVVDRAKETTCSAGKLVTAKEYARDQQASSEYGRQPQEAQGKGKSYISIFVIAARRHCLEA